MQIFSQLRTRYSSNDRRVQKVVSQKGFTLIELLISCAIIAVVTAIVLTKYSAFDSTVLLKGVAYEIALSLREAQVKSVSVVRSASGSDTNAFNYPYGMTFNTNEVNASNPRGLNRKTYVAFRFENASPTILPYYNVDMTGVSLSTTTIGRSMQIKEVCITFIVAGGAEEDCTISRLDISFRRPEFSALFFAAGGVINNFSVTNQPSNATGAKIKVNSANDATNVFVVEVSQFGQISVYKE